MRTFDLEDFKRGGFYLPRASPVEDVDLRGGKVVDHLPAWLVKKLATVTTDGNPSADDFSCLCNLLEQGLQPPDAARTFHESKRGKDARARKVGHYRDYLTRSVGKAAGQVKGKQTAIVDFSEGKDLRASEPLIVFPPSALVGVAADYAHTHAERLEGAVEGFYFSYLTLLGAAISRHVRLETALHVQARLYTILLGESAGARKSSTIDFADDFFDTVGKKRFFNTLYGLGSAEGVASELQDTKLPLLLWFDELKTFVDKSSQKGNVALPMLNTLFEKNKWDNRIRSRKSSITIRDADLSLLGASTIDTYDTMWTAAYTHIGFINRLLVIPCARTCRIALPRAFSPPAMKKLVRNTREQITSLVERKETLFRWEVKAEARWREWYEALEDTIHAKRIDTLGMRLLLLLAVTTGERMITRSVVDAVVATMDYELQARRLTDPIDAETNVAKLEEKIRRTLHVHRAGLNNRDLQRKTNAHRYGLWAWENAIHNLQKNREIQYDKGSGRYRLRVES